MAVVAGAVFAAAASTATADQYFHTAHLDLSPVGSAPLKSGFVNDVHTNGTQNSAQERYQLNGAAPDNTYSVRLHIYNTDSTCTTPAGGDRTRDTATFTTNGSGNGEGDFTFPQTAPWPPPVPPTLRTVYIQWVISDAAGPEYETGCIPVVLGG